MAELMAVVHAKLHGKPLESLPNCANFPLAALEQMPFVAFLYLLEVLGVYVLQSQERPAADFDETICAAAEALADWPIGYHRMLEEMGKKFLALDPTAVGLCRQFAPFYEVLFRSRALKKATTFFKDEFIRFGLQSWGRALVDGKLLRSKKEYGAPRFISKTEFARRHRIWAPTLRRLIEEGAIVASNVGAGRARGSIVDLERSTPPEPSAGAISVRQAAKYAGIPVSVLEHLRQIGALLRPPRKGKGAAWYKQDVEAFVARVLDVPHASEKCQETVKLADVMRMKVSNSAVKAEVVLAILDGRLRPIGKQGRNLSGLLLDKRQVDEIIVLKRAELENSYTVRGAAIRTGLCMDVVPSAIAAGMLDSFTSKRGTRIPAGAVERFNEAYVPLTRLATRLQTASHHLARICAANEIPIITLPRPYDRPGQPVLPREMEGKLAALWREEKERLDAVRRDLRETRYLNSLRQYLDRLRSTGEPMPRRRGEPNKVAIARACGFGRHVLYKCTPCIALLTSFDQEERRKQGAAALEPLVALERYLKHIEDTGASIPTRNGKPNLSRIARFCGFKRDYFYHNPEARELLDTYMETLARRRQVESPTRNAYSRRGADQVTV